jgi:hypothetical protein
VVHVQQAEDAQDLVGGEFIDAEIFLGRAVLGIRVPKIEATARTINRGIVSRTEDRAAQREGKNPLSFSVDNGYLTTKKQFSLAETQRPQRG